MYFAVDACLRALMSRRSCYLLKIISIIPGEFALLSSSWTSFIWFCQSPSIAPSELKVLLLLYSIRLVANSSQHTTRSPGITTGDFSPLLYTMPLPLPSWYRFCLFKTFDVSDDLNRCIIVVLLVF